MHQTVECGKCHGTGRQKLSPGLQRVLDLFTHGKSLTTDQVRERINLNEDSEVRATAITNRLNKLRKLGLIDREPSKERRRQGHYTYFATTKS